MLIQFCDMCKVSSKFPSDVCLSCAYADERRRRISLETQLMEFLNLTEGISKQARTAVENIQRGGNIDPTLSSAVLQLPEAKVV